MQHNQTDLDFIMRSANSSGADSAFITMHTDSALVDLHMHQETASGQLDIHVKPNRIETASFPSSGAQISGPHGVSVPVIVQAPERLPEDCVIVTLRMPSMVMPWSVPATKPVYVPAMLSKVGVDPFPSGPVESLPQAASTSANPTVTILELCMTHLRVE